MFNAQNSMNKFHRQVPDLQKIIAYLIAKGEFI